MQSRYSKIVEIPYMRVDQKGMSFYISRIRAVDLRDIVDFHFREPYKEYIEYKSKDFDALKKELEESGVGIREETTDWDVQRVLNRRRVYEIKKYIETDPEAIFPSSVLLAIDTSKYESCSENEIDELDDYGIFRIVHPSMAVSVIDGQHRLAGLFLSNDAIIDDFEVPVVFMLNVSTPVAAKLFQHINGKQRQVNKSVIFDLFDNIAEEDIDTQDDLETKNYHTICVNLYTDPESPFYRQIKMLGVGGGAVSQAFFIDACKQNLKCFKSKTIQERYDALYDYFQLVQSLFPQDWPKPMGEATDEEIDRYSRFVLKEKKSQLAKTNGLSSMLSLYNWLEENNIGIYAIKSLVGEIDWRHIEGTGASAQRRLFEKLRDIIIEKMALQSNFN